jgi:hypothetical protein
MVYWKLRGMVQEQSLPVAVLRVMGSRTLRRTALGCIHSIMYHFFFLQYKAALFPGRIPVSSVDHPLDLKIPFTPKWVAVYLDFVAFWVRILGFLLTCYRRRAIEPVRDFLESMGKLYGFAAEVYSKHLSTTNRPKYLARPRFFIIHMVDPHLMCIPSLHVMVVIRSYTKLREILRVLGDEDKYASQLEEIRQGALAITEAILYVKQHSVNCVAAAMYAMTCFDPCLFPPEEAEDFASRLFAAAPSPLREDTPEIRAHILNLYRSLLRGGESKAVGSWEEPLLAFLQTQPRKG